MRYPTRGGLILPPSEIGFSVPSPEAIERRGAVTTHHGYFERARYIDVRFRCIFRNLITNVYPMLADEHTELHCNYDAPRRPKDSLMIEVLDDYLTMNGVITCVREKHTRQPYDIQPEEWRHIKRGYRGQNRLAG